MGLFDFLLGADITGDWVIEPQLELEFRFDDFSLCGVRLEDRAEELSGLGPAEDRRAARKGLLLYYSLGLQMETDHELVAAFVLFWVWPNDLNTPFGSFSGRCTQNGKTWPLNRETNFLDFTARFGEPDRREDDEAGMVFVYLFDAVRMEVEFDDLDLLTSIAVLPRE